MRFAKRGKVNVYTDAGHLYVLARVKYNAL